MVVIDPRVMAMITALQEAGAPGLADLARAAAEAGERDHVQDAATETTRQPSADARARRQFEAARIAVETVLDREVTIADRLRSLAIDLEVGEVILTPSDEQPGERVLEVLTDKQRILAITDFRKAWKDVCKTVSDRLASDADGVEG